MGCSNPLGLLGLLLALCLLIFSQVSARELPQIAHAVEASKATARILADPTPYGAVPSAPTYGEVPSGPSYGAVPSAPTYGAVPSGPSYGGSPAVRHVCTAYNRCRRPPRNDTPTTEKNTNTKN